MAQKPETTLINNIVQKVLRKQRVKWLKIHGSRFQRAGTPDLFVCRAGRLLVLEAKMPGEEPTRLQAHELTAWQHVGAYAAVVHSVDEAAAALDAAYAPTCHYCAALPAWLLNLPTVVQQQLCHGNSPEEITAALDEQWRQYRGVVVAAQAATMIDARNNKQLFGRPLSVKEWDGEVRHGGAKSRDQRTRLARSNTPGV